MTRETRIQKLERLIAEREQARETPSERQARSIGYPKPRPADDTPTKSASARAAAQLGIGGES